MKNSFILYNDQAEVVKALSNEQAGQLFKLIFSYIEGEKIEENEIDPIVKIAFIPIKTTLKRDLGKWEAYVEKQTANGIKGGRPKKEKTQKTQAFISKPKKADSVSVSVSVSEDINISSKIKKTKDYNQEIKTFIETFNSLRDTNFKATKEVTKLYNYWRDTFTEEEILTSVKRIPKHEWLGNINYTPSIFLRTNKDWIDQCLNLKPKSNSILDSYKLIK